MPQNTATGRKTNTGHALCLLVSTKLLEIRHETHPQRCNSRKVLLMYNNVTQVTIPSALRSSCQIDWNPVYTEQMVLLKGNIEASW